MSDTTTITPEERARLREQADKSYLLPLDEDEVPSVGFDGLTDDRIAYIAAACNSIPRLLTALEAAEKALLKEEVYSEELESQLQDAESEYNTNWAVQAISDVARLVGVYEQCSETGDDIGAAVIEAVQDLKAENARLRAERGWLAENAADRPCAYDSCPFGLHRPTGPDDDDCDKTRAQCWQEAARRAVADAESEVEG